MNLQLLAGLGLVMGLSSAAQADTDLKREYSPKELGRIQGLTAEYFQRIAVIKDDQLETVATIDTAKGYSSHGKFTDRVRSDNFFRAFIDKATGVVRYQLYEEVRYNFEWRDFKSASVLLSDRPTSLPITIIGHAADGCFASVCSYIDSIGIPLTEEVVRQIASGGRGTTSLLWPFRLKAQNGMDFEDAAIPAEAAGILQAVSNYRQKLAISSQSPAAH